MNKDFRPPPKKEKRELMKGLKDKRGQFSLFSALETGWWWKGLDVQGLAM